MRRVAILTKSMVRYSVFVLFLFILFACTDTQTGTYDTTIVMYDGQDPFEFLVEVSNGKQQITPLSFLQSSREVIFQGDEGMMISNKDYAGMSGYDLCANIESIPSLTYSPTMSLILSNTITDLSVTLFNGIGTSIGSSIPWEEFPDLPQGQYFVVLTIHNEIDESYVNAQCLFVLYVM